MKLPSVYPSKLDLNIPYDVEICGIHSADNGTWHRYELCFNRPVTARYSADDGGEEVVTNRVNMWFGEKASDAENVFHETCKHAAAGTTLTLTRVKTGKAPWAWKIEWNAGAPTGGAMNSAPPTEPPGPQQQPIQQPPSQPSQGQKAPQGPPQAPTMDSLTALVNDCLTKALAVWVTLETQVEKLEYTSEDVRATGLSLFIEARKCNLLPLLPTDADMGDWPEGIPEERDDDMSFP